MSGHVGVSMGERVCELTLERPEKRNAITRAMYDALVVALLEAESNDAVSVIMLRGAGASFTAGNDLNDFLDGPSLNEDHSAVRFLRTLPSLRKVMLAAVHGSTVGIGVTLLLHCDLVLAARSARLSMPFVSLGLVPEAGSSLLLPRLMGHQRASELLLLGKTIDAQEALALGLVNRVVDDAELLEAAREWAREVARRPSGALRATKQLLRSESGSIRSRIEEELQAFQRALGSEEFRSAAAAFLGKSRQG